VRRTWFALTGLLASASAIGQSPGSASAAVQDSFEALAGSRAVRVRVSGYDSLGRTSKTLADELHWWQIRDARNQLVAKSELTSYRDGAMVQRAVGDGVSFYSYNPQRNEYWVTRYGSHGNTVPQRYLENLTEDFTSAMTGSNVYLARLIRESYVLGQFRNWVPGGSEYLLTKNDPATADPVIPTRVYQATDATDYAMFWIGSPARKSIVFELKKGGPTGYELSRIFFAERSAVGSVNRVVDWIAEIYVNFIPAAENFVFVPPSDSKPIVGPRPNIG
jgi:hypothetical protein